MLTGPPLGMMTVFLTLLYVASYIKNWMETINNINWTNTVFQ
jgi:hypothetical protein